MLTAAEYIHAILAAPRSLHRQRLLQQACNGLTPGELTGLYLELSAIGGAELCALAPYFKYFTSQRAQRRMRGQQLHAHPVDGTAQLYTDDTCQKPNKRLYILFSGEFGQFFLPGAMVLDILPPGPKDVLVLRAGQNGHYRFGMPPLGDTAYQVAQKLAHTYETAQYDHITLLGVSASGFFAQRVAEFLQAQIAISFAGVIIADFYQLPAVSEQGITAFDPTCDCHRGGKLRRINVIGSKNERDNVHSNRIRKMRPDMIEAHLINSGTHDVLKRLARFHLAGAFMRLALAETGWPFVVISWPFTWYGRFVRLTRKVFGLQKLHPSQRF